MAEIQVSDPSKLHLKKELTQIRKAARLLRDPGTTSSWKSPLTSSRSVLLPAAPTSITAPTEARRYSGHSQLDSVFPLRTENGNGSGNGKDRRIFLYNWKNHKSSSEKSQTPQNDDRGDNDGDSDDDDESSSVLRVVAASVDESVSDACNGGGGGDSKSDTYLRDLRSSKKIFRCGDANLVSNGTPSAKRVIKKKKSKKTSNHLDIISRYQQKESAFLVASRNSMNSRRLLEGHPSSLPMGYGGQDDSIEQSEDTEDYSNSEDFRQVSGASPLLLKRLKHKNWSHPSSKLLRSRKEDSSYSYSTPALSTSSYNRYGNRNPSTAGSWDDTYTTSLNDGDDDEVDDDYLDLPGRHGCGIPCYWSKRSTPRHQGICGSCYSPSLSDTIRRKGRSLLCGTQRNIYPPIPRHRRSSTSCDNHRFASRSAQGVLPLLTNGGEDGGGGSSLGTGKSDDDELSTNFGELDLEALSRLDGRRWSTSCRSQEGLEIVALNGEGEGESTPESIRSFSHKYRPAFFAEVIGQNIVVQSLVNSISRGWIAPVYLFQGPRGTGKTSTARIFTAALNCLSPQEAKPCGFCGECTDFASGKCKDLLEVDGTDKKGIDRVRYLLKRLAMGPSSSSFSRYKVVVIDECHLLSSKTWLALLKFLEEPPQRVVFIFITTDLDNIPRTIQSRCQKYIFNKLKDGDIVQRLKKVSTDENLEVELDALDLIAMNADGSLRDAETMLEQLSLLGKRITTSLVNELVGVVSDEKLLELLALAMSSDTAETVKRARELMDSGVDPMVLMSQLASLIMDIIAGTYNSIDLKHGDSFFGGRSLSEAELERLKHALKLLSESEKQLRVSSDRSTWFTATLLQLGSMASPDLSQSSSSRRQSCKTTDDDPSNASREVTSYKPKQDTHCMAHKSSSPGSFCNVVNGNRNHQRNLSHSQFTNGSNASTSLEDILVGSMIFRCKNVEKLDDIWVQCVERCHSKTLRQLLHAHGKLLSISEAEGVLVAYVAFGDGNIKSRAERFLSSITNSMEMVLQRNVEVRIILLPNGKASINGVTSAEIPGGLKRIEAVDVERKTVNGGAIYGYSNRAMLPDGTYQSTSDSLELRADGNAETNGKKGRRQEIPMQRIESIIREQRLETAWLQAMERGTPGSLSRLKPEKNQVLPQDGTCYEDQLESVNSMGVSSRQWEDGLNHELRVLKRNDERDLQKDHIGRGVEHCPISPSSLHDGSLVGNSRKDNTGYESGSAYRGCRGFFCWNNTKPHKRGKVRGTPVRPPKGGRFSLFGECARSRK